MGRWRLALPILLAACGDVKSAPDGGATAPDAGPPAAVTVTVGHVFGDALAIEGLTVLLVAPDGTVIETATDAAGTASAEGVVAGSTLLVFLRSQPAGAPQGRLTLAVIGVEPGDAIEFADPTPPSAALGSMTIEFTAHPGAASYRVENGCGAAFPTTNTTPLEFEDACVRGGEVDILIRAADDGGGLLGWLGGRGTFSAGDPLELDGAWSEPEDLAVDLVNVPPEPQTAAGRMNPVIGGLEYDGTSRTPLELAGADVELRLAAPSDYVESRLVAIDVAPTSASWGAQTISRRLPADQDLIEVSLVDELLPWYGVGDSVVGARTLRWTRSTEGRAPDAQLVSTIWIEEGEVSDNGIYLLAPPDPTEVELPALPDGYAEYAPIDPGEIDVRVIGAESSRFDGYRAARQRGFEIVSDDAILAGDPPAGSRLSGGPNAEL